MFSGSGLSPVDLLGKLSASIKRTATKLEPKKEVEEPAFQAFDPEVQRIDFQTLHDRIDPNIRALDDAMRKKEEVKWKIQNKYGGGSKGGKGGMSAAGRSPANEQAATRRTGKEVEFSQPLKGNALIRGSEGSQVVLDLTLETKQKIVSASSDLQPAGLEYLLRSEAELAKQRKKREKELARRKSQKKTDDVQVMDTNLSTIHDELGETGMIPIVREDLQANKAAVQSPGPTSTQMLSPKAGTHKSSRKLGASGLVEKYSSARLSKVANEDHDEEFDETDSRANDVAYLSKLNESILQASDHARKQ